MSTPEENRSGEEAALAELLSLAKRARQNGQPENAMQHLREAIGRNPETAEPYFHLGLLLDNAGRAEEALTCFEKATAIEPGHVALKLNHANVLQKLRRLDQAERVYREVLDSDPDLAIGHFNLGLVYQRKANWPEAAARFRTTVELNPEMPAAWLALARTLDKLGQLQQAFEAYQQALSKEPGNIAARCEVGDLLQQMDAHAQAERAYREVLKQHPNEARAHYGIGEAQQHQGRFEAAVASFRKSIELEPRHLNTYVSLGSALHQLGLDEEKVAQYRAALKINPAFAPARLAMCINQLPVVYRDEQHLQECRKRYAEALEDLYEYYLAADPDERSRAAATVGFVQPFYLAYQGLPLCDLQKRYGQLISLLMSTRYPEFADTPEMPAVEGKIRLGIVSGHLCNHSGWNFFKGLVDAIDRSRFELYMFHTGTHRDRETQLLEQWSDDFVQGPLTIYQWLATIRQRQLHALIFPDIGMDQTAIQLGCLRPAPVQITSWGHPVTSGLPTIDYYLSSDLMEPPGAESHYTEELVRLPNLAMHWRAPKSEPQPIERKELNLPEDCVFYWCCQNPAKYLPQHDDVFPRIARKVRNAAFVFLSLHERVAGQHFKARLEAAFAREGLDMKDHCHFLPRLSTEAFSAATASSDVFLDSIGWSGCNSTLEAIAANRPVVTLPGEFMRARHTLAFLKMMKMEEWIAADKDEYIELAARFGLDAPLRQSVSESIRSRKHRLYRDPDPVRALETFLEQIVHSCRPNTSPEVTEAKPSAEASKTAGDEPDDAQSHWEQGIRYQQKGDLQRAAAAFQRHLELCNPHYHAAQPTPLKPPDQSPGPDDGTVELAGLSYPAIPPVTDPRHRPFWSIVVPVYKRDRYLLQCLTSVLAQWRSDEDMEIIVVDNSSAPAMGTLVQSIGKGIIRYHYHAERLDLQRNWNAAVRTSRGHWVHLLHDDDYILPGFYETLQKRLANAAVTVGAAITAYQNIDEDSTVIFRNHPFGTRRGIVRDWINRIGVSNVLNPPAIVVRRDAYERLGGYSDKILYSTDWEFYMRLASHYEAWYESKVLACYRQHGYSVTTEQDRAGAQGESLWRAIEMSEHYLPPEVRDRLVAKSRRHHFSWCMQRLRRPLLAGNVPGGLRMLREMLRIDSSDESLQDLFDWLATEFAAPLWPALMEACRTIPDAANGITETAELFDWLCGAPAAEARKKLVQAVLELPAVHCPDDFQLTPLEDKPR